MGKTRLVVQGGPGAGPAEDPVSQVLGGLCPQGAWLGTLVVCVCARVHAVVSPSHSFTKLKSPRLSRPQAATMTRVGGSSSGDRGRG